ncbi:S-methyl-5-thioribose-1-phosphate isomerase [Embleya sp. NBC_00896]|uniref:S-methyl-5-thioribose-1-phosphate isomerase n=1 Tax=Embleya sp. NBC_00896 TaxID=2975961 RepID=UPI00386D7F0D|nr:S-methyl-5-thioribose-1-phosphate isomerase [Embleya sp. NBC_00896]
MATDIRSLAWHEGGLRLLDQTALPQRIVYLDITEVDALIDAIRRLAVRGAPALGAAGAYGVAVALLQGEREGWDAARLAGEVKRIRDARPTAVNLAGGVDRVLPLVPAGVDAVLAEAAAVVREDVEANHAIGRNGADWIMSRVERRPLRVLTHCNTGSLATAGWGTALGIIRELHARGVLELVYVDETRPLLQGSRLTAWELEQEGIVHLVQPDGAAASTILRGLADVAVIGADRIAVNGDTANKIGSVGVALACADAGIPFVVAAPLTTFDDATAHGDDITIEERPESEVLEWGGVRVAPAGSRAFNPAFDVTPVRLISAIVNETGVREY